MKKALILSTLIALVLAVAGSALAFPLEVNGDFRLRGLAADDSGVVRLDFFHGGIPTGVVELPVADKRSYFEFRTRLNFTGRVSNDASFFGRFSARQRLGEDNSSGGALDWYGVKLAAGCWNLSLGRQAVTLGQGSILDTGYDAIGTTNRFDGAVARTTSGKVDLTLIGGRMTADFSNALIPVGLPFSSLLNFPVSDWYGLDVSTSLDGGLRLGGAIAHQSKSGQLSLPGFMEYRPGVTYWSLNTVYAAGPRLTFSAEYVKSNATMDLLLPAPASLTSTDRNTRAFFLAGAYRWDKDSFVVQYNDVGRLAVDPFNSGIGIGSYPLHQITTLFDTVLLPGYTHNYKGFTYTYTHPLSKHATLQIAYMDLTVRSGVTQVAPLFELDEGHQAHIRQFAADVSWKF
jgi:hypothetical protein